MIPGIFLYSVLYIVFWQFSDTSENLYLLIPALIASGIGMAGVWPTLTSLGADGINENLLGSATAMIHTFQRIGGALGIAIVLAVVGEGTGIDSFDAHRSGILVIAVGGVATFLCSIFLDRKS